MALHTSTILARTPAAIFSHLSRLQTTYEKHVLLFCLSANSPDLQNLVSRLTSFSSQTTGCLSAPLGETGDLISCSLAIFDKTKTTQFRSTIAGRVAPQVGRWHAFRHKGKGPQPPMELDGLGEQGKGFENVDWDAVWDRSARSAMLPKELEGLRYALASRFRRSLKYEPKAHIYYSRPQDVNSFLFLSDGAPEGLSNALSAFPSTTKVGLPV